MSNEIAVMAPASGSGIGKQLADLLLADPNFLPAMKAAAMGGLAAVTVFFDKGANGWEERPDFKTRLQALALLLAHMEGEPIKRIIHQHLGGPGLDPVEAMRESPALMEATERALEKAKFRTRKRKEPAAVESAAVPEALDLAP